MTPARRLLPAALLVAAAAVVGGCSSPGAGTGGTGAGATGAGATATATVAAGYSWTAARALVPAGYRFGDPSCGAPDFCVAIGRRSGSLSGYVLTYIGSTWSPPAGVDSMPLLSVSCPSPGFCLAVDGEGRVLEFDGATWTTPKVIQPTAGLLLSVSCASPTFCVGVGGGQTSATSPPIASVAVFNGLGWIPQALVPDTELYAVSCTSQRSCVAVGGSYDQAVGPSVKAAGHAAPPGIATVYDGTSWSAPERVDPTQLLTDVACVSARSCVAVGGAAGSGTGTPSDVLTWDGSRWSAPARPDVAGGEILDLACGAPAWCLAVDARGDVLGWDGTRWTPPGRIDGRGLLGIACAVRSSCVALDQAGAVVYGKRS